VRTRIPKPVSIDPESSEEFHPSKCIFLNDLDLIFIQYEETQVWITLKIRFPNSREIIIVESEVSHCGSKGRRDKGQACVREVNKL